MREIGVSILSFGPEIFLPGTYKKIADLLKELGMGVQLLPLRGFQEKYIDYFSNVMSFEGPWNCGGLRDVARRHLFGDESRPSIIDFTIFGSEEACRDRISLLHSYCLGALVIDVPWLPNSLIELGPNMSVGNARKWTSKPSGVVLDTYHWQQLGYIEAELQLQKLGGLSEVRMVHLKLVTEKEVFNFLHNADDDNMWLLRRFLFSDRRREVPIVIETSPKALRGELRLSIKESLKLIKERIELMVP